MKLSGIAAATGSLFLCATAEAQLTLRESQVVEGAYSTIGNLLIDCPAGGAATCLNNDVAMAPVDIDQDPSTSMSSAATLALPPNAAVRTAILYITASGTIDVAGAPGAPWVPADLAAFSARFAPPGAGYTSIIPTRVDRDAAGISYFARYDVTTLVASSGEYLVADALMIPATHPYNRILSWALFVTYDDGSPPTLVNLYDGALNCFMASTTINLSGFRTPAGVPPAALFTAWSVDGHPTLAGESITIGTRMMSNAQNPANNLGNSTVSSPSGVVPRRPATFRVIEEMDLDTFDASNAFTTSQTNVNITFTCGNLEGVLYHMAVLGVQIVAPQITVDKSVLDLNGGTIVAGDELRYELITRTIGGDDAIDVVLRDPLPAGLSYVAGSIEYGVIPKTDQAGDDEAEWTGSELIFRLGAGATSTAGGTIAVGLSEVVSFRAVVDTATTPQNIVNQASLSARGAQGGSGVTSLLVLSSSVAVDALPCDGFANGMCPDAGVIEDAAEILDATEVPDSAETPDAGVIMDAAPTEDAALPDAMIIDQGVEPDAAPIVDATNPDAPAVRDAGVVVIADAGTSEDGDGCGCKTTGRTNHTTSALLLLALVLVARRRNR